MRIHSSVLIVKHKSSFWRFLAILSAGLILIALTACGGGGSTSGGGGGGQVVSIAINPTTATIVVTQNKTFTATVSNSSNTAVSWSVQEGSTGGAVTSSGAYTAPSQAGTYHVVATAQADTSKSASATVTVTAAPAPTFTSTAPKSATQGTELDYTVTATDSAGGTVSFQLTTAPNGATLTGSTMKWTPTAAQSRTANSFTITATTSEGGSATQSFSISPAGTISINRMVTYHTIDTSGALQATSVPDNGTSPIAALVPDGTGGFTTIAGAGSTGGNYSIPSVPAGYYWLQHGPTSYFWTQKSTIDSGVDYDGASSVSYGSPGTTLAPSMSGSSAWQTSDAAIFYAPNTGIYKPFYTSGTSGSTVLTDTLNFSGQPLMNSSTDAAFVYHMVHHTVTGGGYQSVDQFYGPQAFSITDGTANTLSQPFTNVTLNNTVRAYVKGSQFATFTSAMGSGAVNLSTCQGLQALPAPANTGVSDPFNTGFSEPAHSGTSIVPGDVVLVGDCSSGVPMLTDTDLGDVQYGNPYPNGWPVFSEFVQKVNVPYQLSGTGAYEAVAANVVYNTTLPTSTSPIVPVVGPVVSPTIAASATSASTSLLTNVTAVGTTPVISWQSPTVGTPTAYVITITRMISFGGNTVPQNSATLFVGGGVHSIQVPPGVLTSGQTYYIRIASRVVTSVDGEAAPYRRNLPFGQSEVLSGFVNP
jgi:hypothetical protein